jgi:hypothetical protein
LTLSAKGGDVTIGDSVGDGIGTLGIVSAGAGSSTACMAMPR